MRAKRWGRAGHGREQPRRRVIFLAVLAGLLVCVVLPVRAQKKTGKLCFPLDTTQYRVSDGYGWRQDPFTGERTFHKGIDLACAEGTDVIAAEGGAVVQAYCSTSYGTCLRVLHTDGSESLYAHLQYAYVRPGEVVETGQLLGAAGRSGRATGYSVNGFQVSSRMVHRSGKVHSRKYPDRCSGMRNTAFAQSFQFSSTAIVS